MDLPKIHMVCISFSLRRFSLLVLTIQVSAWTIGQKPVKEFYQDSLALYLSSASPLQNKIIPKEFENATKIALHYFPELVDTKIVFQIKKRTSPLAAHPTFWAMFRKASKRKYKIIISSKSIPKLDPILLKNLSFNAQIGVLGHEISHISTYNKKPGIYFLKLVFMHLSKKKIDKAEFETDKTCIEHGLGYQLLDWSIEVRAKLALTQWVGSNSITGERERYMNPETIRRHIAETEIYH